MGLAAAAPPICHILPIFHSSRLGGKFFRRRRLPYCLVGGTAKFQAQTRKNGRVRPGWQIISLLAGPARRCCPLISLVHNVGTVKTSMSCVLAKKRTMCLGEETNNRDFVFLFAVFAMSSRSNGKKLPEGQKKTTFIYFEVYSLTTQGHSELVLRMLQLKWKSLRCFFLLLPDLKVSPRSKHVMKK